MSHSRWILITGLLLACCGTSPRDACAILERSGEHLLDDGQVRLFVTNLGVLGNPTYPSFSDLPSLEWPAGSRQEFLLEAGLWIGARDRAGHLIGVSTAVPRSELRPSLDPVDRTYASFEGAPGTLRLGQVALARDADDDADGLVDEEFLNGKDDDGDGRIDEDYFALGSQMLACEYRDDTPEAVEQLITHAPLHVAVRQLVSTWKEGTEGLDRCVVVDYQIENVGAESLYDMFLGIYVDPDVGPRDRDGYWRDDRYSIETLDGAFAAVGDRIRPGCEEVAYEIPVAIADDAPDGPGVGGGDAEGLLAVLVLDHSTDRWGFRRPERVGPNSIHHLEGRVRSGSLREVLSDDSKYRLLSEAGFEGHGGVGDQAFVVSVGPFEELVPGDHLVLTVAFIIARDRGDLQQTAPILLRQFHGRWMDLDGTVLTGTSGRETCLTIAESIFCGFTPFLVDHDCDEPESRSRAHAGCRNSRIQGYCPGNPGNLCSDRVEIRSARCGALTYVDFDCDPCTPAVDGAETLVHWAESPIGVSPWPVSKRITPGDREVLVEWDNAAELPLANGEVPDVAGYRVWRTAGWTRPPGASGPSGDQWELVAEYRRPGSGLSAPLPEIDHAVGIVRYIEGPGDSLFAQYDVGYYRMTDRGLLNGYVSFYDVTAVGIDHQGGGVEIRGAAPRARRDEAIAPREVPCATGQIRVVPNPYQLTAGWDLQPNRLAPSGRKLAFTGLPPIPATISIFTIAGDLVRTIAHEGVAGSVDWDLLSTNGQPVSTGLYLYVVDGSGLHHVGRLVIVK